MPKSNKEEAKGHSRLGSKGIDIDSSSYANTTELLSMKQGHEGFMTEMSDLGGDGTVINLNPAENDELFNGEDFKDEIISAFQVFDKEKKGLISKQKLKIIITQLGKTMKPEDAEFLVNSLQDEIVIKNGIQFINYYNLFCPENNPRKSFFPS
ncbi:unnamed protein product [Moneuplotes crassus]|uniref:EF-hand domain-containing protein n=2 Tax=Euplotes crassus TaxID=5936 RepID=A0AAD1Y329_EUPCR|nr:unnamed protein product [Moneuplotes crassus]